MSRRPWDRERSRPGTRRQHLEAALVAERLALWGDVADIILSDRDDGWFLTFAERIRAISEALGYPSDPETLPACVLIAYETVETVPELGIYAKPWDRRELAAGPITISAEMRAALADHPHQGDQDDD